MSVSCNGTVSPEVTENSAVFYRINNVDVTYTYFGLNLMVIIVHLLIIILNGILIRAIQKSKKIQEPSGHCLIALSAAHIWLGIMMVYTGIYGLANMQEKNECLIRFGLTHSSLLLVCWQNVMLTVDRFIQIECPFWYKKHFDVSSVWILNVVVACVILFYCLTPLILSWYRPKGDRNNVCEYLNILPAAYLQGVLFTSFFGLFAISAMYLILLWTARKHLNTLRMLSASHHNIESVKGRQWRAVGVACSISGLYLVCWCPPGIFCLVLTSDPNYPKITYSYSTTLSALIMLPGISGFVNPIIYTLHREIKFKFLQIVGLKRKDERFHSAAFYRLQQLLQQSTSTINQGTSHR